MCCGSLGRESAGQNMTFCLENKQEVDTIPNIVVRQTMTRQPSTLHDNKVEIAQTISFVVKTKETSFLDGHCH